VAVKLPRWQQFSVPALRQSHAPTAKLAIDNRPVQPVLKPRFGVGPSALGESVSDSAKSEYYFPVEASIPDSTASLESILCTEELRRRQSRLLDYKKENQALVALLSALVASHSNILQTLAETILDVTQCDSSGVSLLTKDDGGKRFYWPAIAGMWKPHVGGGTPRDFGPCGDVLDRNCTLLFKHFERRYPYLLPVTPPAEECLLVPFYVGGKAVGTIWAIMHSDRRKFDAEDERLMNTLGQFASLAYQTLESIEDLKLQIGAREKAEAEVRKLASGLEAKVRRLVNANIIGICVWNLEGEIIEANEAFLHMVGYSREDLLSGRVRWRDLTPAEWRDWDERAVAELKATGTAQPFQKEYFRKDGSRVPVLLGGAMFEGSGTEGVAFVLDLSEQKRAEEALRASEERWSKLAENSSAGIALVAPDGRFIAANLALQKMLGYTEDELHGRTLLDITHEEDRGATEARIGEAYEGHRQVYRVEKRYLRKDGGTMWADVSMVLVPASGSKSAFFSAVIVDRTERKWAEEALQKAQAELAHVTRVTTLGELTASITHEINQPLAAIATNANAALRWLSSDSPNLVEAHEAIRRIVRDRNRTGKIIDGVRALAKKAPPKMDCLDLNETIGEVVAMARSEVQRNRVSLQTQLANDLPLISGDKIQLQQVILNLLINAMEAMSGAGESPPELRVSSQKISEPSNESSEGRSQDSALTDVEWTHVLITVRDTGPGLDPQRINRLFDPFYTTKPQGLGMGLAISRSIIEAHGGRLSAKANAPRGAVFQFTLPIRDKRT
jgi:PAS domain S-box-containing protein